MNPHDIDQTHPLDLSSLREAIESQKEEEEPPFSNRKIRRGRQRHYPFFTKKSVFELDVIFNGKGSFKKQRIQKRREVAKRARAARKSNRA